MKTKRYSKPNRDTQNNNWIQTETTWTWHRAKEHRHSDGIPPRKTKQIRNNARKTSKHYNITCHESTLSTYTYIRGLGGDSPACPNSLGTGSLFQFQMRFVCAWWNKAAWANKRCLLNCIAGGELSSAISCISEGLGTIVALIRMTFIRFCMLFSMRSWYTVAFQIGFVNLFGRLACDWMRT